MREPNDPPSIAVVTAKGMASALVGPGTGNPTNSVDCAAPGRPVTSRTCCGLTLGLLIAGAAPFAEPLKLAAIAFFISGASNLPAKYECAREARQSPP